MLRSTAICLFAICSVFLLAGAFSAEAKDLPRISPQAQENVNAYTVMWNKSGPKVKTNPTKLPNPVQLRRSGKPAVIKLFRDVLWGRINPTLAAKKSCRHAFETTWLSKYVLEDIEGIMLYAGVGSPFYEGSQKNQGFRDGYWPSPKNQGFYTAGDAVSFVTTARIESNWESIWSYGPKIGQAKIGDNGHSYYIFQLNDQGRLTHLVTNRRLSGLSAAAALARDPRENARLSAMEFRYYYNKGQRGSQLALSAQRPGSYSNYRGKYNEFAPAASTLIKAWERACLPKNVVK